MALSSFGYNRLLLQEREAHSEASRGNATSVYVAFKIKPVAKTAGAEHKLGTHHPWQKTIDDIAAQLYP